jgi:diguanylate cyclase (GGDEF)-like protein/PAS domain S-box-containing protein
MLSLEQISLIILACTVLILLIRVIISNKIIKKLQEKTSDYAFIKGALSSLALPAYYKNKNGKIIGVNKLFEREFGDLKKDALEKLHPLKAPSTSEIDLLYDNSIEKSTMVYLSNFLDANNNILGSIGVLLKIDAQKDEKRSIIEQKNRLTYALEASKEGYWEWNIQEDIALYSKRWKEIMGYTYQDDEPVALSSWLNLVYSLDLTKTNEALKAILDGKSEILDIEHRVKTADKPFWVNVCAKAIYDIHHTPLKLIGTIKDISKIKNTEEELRNAKELFTEFMDTLPILSFIKDKNGKYLYINSYYQKFLGFKEWKGKTTEQLYPPEISTAIKDSDREALYESINTHEEIIPDAQGNPRLFKTHKHQIERNDEDLLCGVGVDITQEKIYKEGMNLYLKILDNTKDSIVITDASKRVIAVNKSFEHITGYISSEIKGKDINVRNSNKHPKEYYASIWEEVNKNGEWSGELYNKNKDDSVKLEVLSIHSILDTKKAVKHYYMVIQTTQREKIINKTFQLPMEPITNLPDKNAFKHMIELAVSKAQTNQEKFSIVYVNVDDFNIIGKNKGTEIANFALKEIGKKLLYAIRQNDALAKLDSDEFAIILEDTKTQKDISIICERIMEEMTKPILMNNIYETISLSIGASIYPDHSDDPKKLIDFAHGSMYKAKREGKNCYIIHKS